MSAGGGASSRAIRAGRAFVEFFLEDGRFHRALRRNERRVRAWAKRVGDVSKSAFKVAAAGLATFIFPLKTFADFDDQMRVTKAVTQATTEEWKGLVEQAKMLGRTTGFTARQVAELMTELGRAGFDPQELGASTEDVLNLAYATGTELPRAAEIAAASLRAFGMDASEMGRVSDVMVQATNSAAFGMEDLFEAMKMVAPIAVRAGSDIEDTAAAMGVLADNGIKGSLAGTAIARAYKNLSSHKLSKDMRRMGIAVADSAGNMRPLGDILGEIANKTAGFGSKARLATFEKLFGRGQAAAMALADAAGTTGGRLSELQETLRNSQGAAKRAADEMDGGLGGAIRRLQSAFEGVQIAIGEALSKLTVTWGNRLTALMGYITVIVEKNPRLVQGVLAAVAALGALSVGGLAAMVALKGLAFSLSVVRVGMSVMMNAAMMAGRAVVASFMAMASPMGLVLAILAALVAWLVYTSGAFQELAAFLGSEFKETWGMIVKLIGSGDLKAAGELALALLKAAWAVGIAKIEQKWIEYTSKLSSWMLTGTAAAESVWSEFTTALVNTFDIAIASIRDAWQSMTNWLGDKIAIVIAKTTGQDVEEVRQTLREDQERARKDFTGDARARAAERNEANEKRQAEIEQRLKDQQEALQEDVERRIEASKREALRARKKFDDAQAAAAAKLEEKKKAEEENKDGPTTPGDVALSINAAAAQAVAMDKTNAAVSLRSTEGQKRLAEAMGLAFEVDKAATAVENMQEAVVEELGDIKDELEDGPVIKGAKT